MFCQPKVEPVLFQQERIKSGRFDYTIYTYWVQLTKKLIAPDYNEVILINNYKELGDDCYLIESAEELTMSSVIIL